VSFVRWHLAVGFERLYLFFDDPCDDEDVPVGWREIDAFCCCAADDRDDDTRPVVRFRRGDQTVEAARAALESYATFGPFVESEVQARQCLNAEHAARLARQRGLRWLVHIDVDEAFYVASREALVAHFAHLDAEAVGHVVYANHEGVPGADHPDDPDDRDDDDDPAHATAALAASSETENTDDEARDYFARVTLFKANHLTVPLTPEAHRAMEWWKRRTRRAQFLLCYDNGKSAVRLVDGPGLRPSSVHAWTLPAGCGLARRTALADPRELRVDELLSVGSPKQSAHHKKNHLVFDGAAEPLRGGTTGELPCILHYVVCGKFWLETKYRILGDFPDAWFGGALPIAPSFHLDARDVVVRGDSADRDAAIQRFYDAHVSLRTCPRDLIDAHLAAGVLRRFTRVADVVRRRTSGAASSGDAGLANRHVAEKRGDDIPDAPVAVSQRPVAPAVPPPPPPMQDATARNPAADKDAPLSFEKAWILSKAAQTYL